MDQTTLTILTMICSLLVAIVGSGSATLLVQRRIEKNKDKDPIRAGVKLLLQDRIENLCKQVLEEETVPYSLLKFINSAYTTYKALGGDGDLSILLDKVHNHKVDYSK